MAPVTPPRSFGGSNNNNTGKSPAFSSGSSPSGEDTPGSSSSRFTVHLPRPSHRAGSSRDGSSTLNSSTLSEPSSGSVGIATLVAEMRDVKELLRAVLVEKTSAQHQQQAQQHQDHHPPPNVIDDNKAGGNLMTSPLYTFYDDDEILNLARNHCPNDDGMALFREHFLSQFCESGQWTQETDPPTTQNEIECDHVVFSCKGPENAVLRVHRTDASHPRRSKRLRFSWPGRKASSSRVQQPLHSDDAKRLAEADWPVSVGQGTKVEGKICIRWRVRLPQFKVSWKILYLYYGNNGAMRCDRFDRSLLMAEIEDRQDRPIGLPLAQLSHEVISPGKIWVIDPCHESTIDFDQLSVLSAILLRPWDMSSSLVFSEPLDGGNQYTIALDTICSFAGPWRPMHMRRRVCLLGEPGKSTPSPVGDEPGSPARFSFYRRHEIRCFSSRDPHSMGLKYGDGPTESYLRGSRHVPHQFPVPSRTKPKGLATSRQSGAFPTLLEGVERRFAEKRLSVVCLASDFGYASGLPSFRILVLSDFPDIAGFTEDDFGHWRTAGLRVEGPAAWQMVYQATVFGLIPIWEREWASCLDELDNSVRVKMEDIMDAHTKDSMMFDASFRRSRFYFEVIQMLRIFSDMIRETGRDLQAMIADPHMARHLSWYDDHDEVSQENSKRMLRANWDIVEAQQVAAERRLLDRITELSGDMQSLRDGLFNATALLEASRSTAMARYVFAFTIVTVVFLPPSFIATVFSTGFFNKDDVGDTISIFKNSTVVVALITYGVSIVLIYLADRLGLVSRAWTTGVAWAKATMPRKRRAEAKESGREDESLEPAAV